MKLTIDTRCSAEKCPAKLHLEVEMPEKTVAEFNYASVPAFCGWLRLTDGAVLCPDHHMGGSPK